MALVAAWLVAWAASPHGEVARQTSIVGAVAVAGGDDAALAWLELTHGSANGTLHVLTVDGEDRFGDELKLSAGVDATAFRLADAGGRRFVLATEHRTEGEHRIDFRRFGGGLDDAPATLRDGPTAGAWQMAAAGDELIVAVEVGDFTEVHVLGSDGKWLPAQLTQGRVLVGAGGGHVVEYVTQSDRASMLTVAPSRDASWTAQLSRAACFGDGGRPPTVTSVVGQRGGYARLARRGAEGCVDGIRDGKPFAYRDVPLAGISAARLAVDDEGRLSVHEEQDAQVTRRRVLLPDLPGGPMLVDDHTIDRTLDGSGVRYRLFGGTGRLGVTTLATRVSHDETEVVLERSGVGGETRVLAPVRRYQPDHRPALRRLAVLPLAFLLLAVFGAWRLLGRLRKLSPLSRDVNLSAGPAVIEGELAVDADAPTGGLRVRRGRSRLTVFLEGAQVLRASDVRPRSQPRGDAVDVASGATVVATGTVEPEQIYRDETTLRARRGDLVVVGCTLAEARARTARRLLSSALLLGITASLIVSIIVR
jgi:hypothetical protein